MNANNGHIKNRFEEVYNLYKTKIYNYCYRMTGDKEKAEDLTHEVFFKAYRGLKSFNGKSHISTWIYKIAINTYKNLLRNPRQQFTPLLNDIDEEFITCGKMLPLKQAEVKELEGCMQKFINELPVTHRIPLIFHELQGLKIAEIAESMNISERNVKVRLIRARKKLKDILCSQCYFFNPKNPCNCRGEDWKAK